MKKLAIALFIATPCAWGETIQEAFTRIYNTDFWLCAGNTESVSGPQSTLRETEVVRAELPKLLKKYAVKKFVDAPCGDFNWMKAVDLSCIEQYIGLDVVPALIAENKKKYACNAISFAVCDIIFDRLPDADLLLCRHCLEHLTNKQIMAFINNLKKIDTRYLLATTYKNIKKNGDIKTGEYRAVNLELPPFNFPAPRETIIEDQNNTCLCLWLADDLPVFAEAKTIQDVFTRIYDTSFWVSGYNTESVSGHGSTLRETEVIRTELPKLLKKYGIKKFIDAPCGDFNWMKMVDLSCIEHYLGLDVVPDLIEENKKKYASDKRTFALGDITVDTLPEAGVLLCRDCLQHLSNKQIMIFVTNLKKSKIRYLLATTYKKEQKNTDTKTGGYRSVNLELPPLNFPEPQETIVEGFRNKYVCLWPVEDLPDFAE